MIRGHISRIPGTSIKCWWVADRVQGGEDEQVVADDYGITVEQVREAVRRQRAQREAARKGHARARMRGSRS